MTVTHDQAWQTAIGRGLMQYYVRLRGQVDAPWLIGCLTLVYTSLAVYFTVKILGIEDELWKIFVVSAVFTLNISFICSAAVYIYLLDIYALSLLLAVLAVWTYETINNRALAVPASGIILSLSMGLYQSYFAVAIALFIFLVIKMIMGQKDNLRTIITNALYMICTAGIGAVLYSLTLKAIQNITGVEPYDSYNSVSNISNLSVKSVISSIPGCYRSCYNFFFKSQPYANNLFVIINVAFIILAIIMYSYCLIRFKSNVNRILLVLTIVIFPLGANCIYILSSGMIHYLMVFSYQTFYLLMLFPLLNNDFKIGGGTANRLVTALVLILSFVVIRFSNDLFYYQKLVGEGTEASITGILYDLERYPEFDENSMQIVMIGHPGIAIGQNYEMVDLYGSYPGVGNAGTTITYESVFQSYLHYVLGRNYNFNYSEEVAQEIIESEGYQEMSAYPQEGYIRVIDGYLVLKFE